LKKCIFGIQRACNKIIYIFYVITTPMFTAEGIAILNKGRKYCLPFISSVRYKNLEKPNFKPLNAITALAQLIGL